MNGGNASFIHIVRCARVMVCRMTHPVGPLPCLLVATVIAGQVKPIRTTVEQPCSTSHCIDETRSPFNQQPLPRLTNKPLH